MKCQKLVLWIQWPQISTGLAKDNLWLFPRRRKAFTIHQVAKTKVLKAMDGVTITTFTNVLAVSLNNYLERDHKLRSKGNSLYLRYVDHFCP